MKTFENPMLQVVSIKNSDILTTSNPQLAGEYGKDEIILAPGQRGLDFNSWYEGY